MKVQQLTNMENALLSSVINVIKITVMLAIPLILASIFVALVFGGNVIPETPQAEVTFDEVAGQEVKSTVRFSTVSRLYLGSFRLRSPNKQSI